MALINTIRNWRLAPLFTAVALLAGCQTPYQPSGLTGGYNDHPIDPQTAHVKFVGNGHTSREMVEHYFLYRCAELTAQAGYRYFMVLPKVAMGSTGDDMTRARSNGFDRSMMRKVKTVTTFIVTPAGPPIVHWTEEGTIRMFNDDAVIPVPIVGWDAKEVLATLGPYVQSGGTLNDGMPKSWVFAPHRAKRQYADLFPTARAPVPEAVQAAEAAQAPLEEPAQTAQAMPLPPRAETQAPALPVTTLSKPAVLPPPDARRNVASGSTTVIAAHAEWDQDCKPLGAAPAITVLDPSKHGSVDVKQGNFDMLASRAPTQCQGAPVYGTQIFYTPDAGFHGIDRIRYEVVSARARSTRTIEIAVD